MPERIVVSNFATGFENDVEPFLIDNDAFPVIENAVTWRGRVMRKRGTEFLGRLRRGYTAVTLGVNTDGAGAYSGNIFTLLSLLTAETYANIIPTGFSIIIGASTFTDALANGVLADGLGGTGTINYATGAFTIVSGPAATLITVTFSYYPTLPVMGLEDFEVGTVNQQQLVAFDTRYSYQISQATNLFHNVNFYKNTSVPFTWSGTKYNQFYTVNYMGVTTIANAAQNTGCMWATNGATSSSTVGMHFITIVGATIAGPNTAGAVATITTSAAHNLSVANLDYVFINEVNGVTLGAAGVALNLTYGLNGTSGIATVTGANTFTIPAPYATGAWISGGIVQYMTRSSSATRDGIRWYDGDNTVLSTFGWVNFAPPLNVYDATLNPTPFYLVGADIITAFKNRLIFSGVWLQTTSGTNSTPAYYPNRIVYSQVGTPYYALPLPSLLTTNAPTAYEPAAWFQNTIGRGGFLTAPYYEEIISVSVNEDVLIYIMEKRPLKLVYTLDDTLPFIFQTISPEFGGQSTFSAVPLDRGVLSVGEYGFMMTDQVTNKRIDTKIPDQIYDLSILTNVSGTLNDSRMVTAYRDYRNGWVYFTYLPSEYQNGRKGFNARTLIFNYMNNSFAVFNENYTHYGTFRRSSGLTWAGLTYGSWSEWATPWEVDELAANYPNVIGGNQHGFVMIRSGDTGEDTSQMITAVNISTNTITSPSHGLDSGDFIQISGMIGITVSGTATNIFQVRFSTIDTFLIFIEGGVPVLTGTYIGGGIYKRYSKPKVKSKQFAPHWGGVRGVRVGTQRYLLDKTPTGEITAQIFGSQNDGVDLNSSTNNGYLIFSSTVSTHPDANLYGNTAFSGGQEQIWHKCSNSFSGDSIQFGFTLSDDQMFDPAINEQEIALHAVVLDTYPGRSLSL